MKILITILFSLNLLAMSPNDIRKKGILYFKSVTHGEVTYDFVVTVDKGVSRLSVYNESGKLILKREKSYALEGFKDLDIISIEDQKAPYLVTFWLKGAHGSNSEVFSLDGKSQKPIKIINSYLAMSISKSLESFSITYDKYLKSGSLGPVKHRTTFKGKGQITDEKL